MTNDEIKKMFEKRFPNLEGYYLSFLDEMIGYLEELNDLEAGPEKLALTWTYPETIQVGALNDAADRIKTQLIERGEEYIWRKDSPKNEYERGLYNAMRLLQQIVHWTNPS